MAINFTKEHLSKLKDNVATLVLDGTIISGPMGQTYDAFSLVNTLSIKSLQALSGYLSTVKAKLSVSDEWVENPNQEEINKIEFLLETVSLVIGFKRKEQERKDNARELARVEKQIEELEAAQKSPQQLLEELKAKAASLSE